MWIKIKSNSAEKKCPSCFTCPTYLPFVPLRLCARPACLLEVELHLAGPGVFEWSNGGREDGVGVCEVNEREVPSQVRPRMPRRSRTRTSSLSRYVGRTGRDRRTTRTDRRTDLQKQKGRERRARESQKASLSSSRRPSSTASIALTPVALARPRPPQPASHLNRCPCRLPSVREWWGWPGGLVSQSPHFRSDFQCHHHYHPSSPFTSPKFTTATCTG